MRNLKIKPVLNGFVVDVGCQKIVFTSLVELTKELKRYYGAKKPWEIEKDWEENSINSNKKRTHTVQIGSTDGYTATFSGTFVDSGE